MERLEQENGRMQRRGWDKWDWEPLMRIDWTIISTPSLSSLLRRALDVSVSRFLQLCLPNGTPAASPHHFG